MPFQSVKEYPKPHTAGMMTTNTKNTKDGSTNAQKPMFDFFKMLLLERNGEKTIKAGPLWFFHGFLQNYLLNASESNLQRLPII